MCRWMEYRVATFGHGFCGSAIFVDTENSGIQQQIINRHEDFALLFILVQSQHFCHSETLWTKKFAWRSPVLSRAPSEGMVG